MPQYDDRILRLYHENKLSREKQREIRAAFRKDALLSTGPGAPQPEISVTRPGGVEKISTAGAVNFLRRDLVQLKGMPRPMTHSMFASKYLAVGITRTESDYLLKLSGPSESLCTLKGKTLNEQFSLKENGRFLRVAPGKYRLTCGGESLSLSLE